MKKNKNIGILGGSFNPAHEGHLYISRQSYLLLDIDEIWWIVAMQNPLKSASYNFEERIKSAEEISSKDNRIYVSDFEKKHDIRYSFITLTMLKEKFPDNNFIWLMGSDNLLCFDMWYKWEEIISSFNIVIFPRLNNLSEEQDKVILNYRKRYEYKGLVKNFCNSVPPNLMFMDIEKKNISSTMLRKNREN